MISIYATYCLSFEQENRQMNQSCSDSERSRGCEVPGLPLPSARSFFMSLCSRMTHFDIFEFRFFVGAHFFLCLRRCCCCFHQRQKAPLHACITTIVVLIVINHSKKCQQKNESESLRQPHWPRAIPSKRQSMANSLSSWYQKEESRKDKNLKFRILL